MERWLYILIGEDITSRRMRGPWVLALTAV
jgi:hypothetical protein